MENKIIDTKAAGIELVDTQEACELLGVKRANFVNNIQRRLSTYKNPDNKLKNYFDRFEVQVLKENIERAKKNKPSRVIKV